VNRTTAATEDWRRIAQGDDRFHSIASVPGKRGNWTAEEFYEHGRADWASFRKQWDQYDPNRKGTCLEIGCGIGRMTAALAPDFERVIAVDVSADMLAAAAEVVPDTVDLRQTDGSALPVADQSVDHLFSVHVMQHLESRADVETYFREFLRVLRPGSTMLVHVMLKSSPIGIRQRLRDRFDVWRSRVALRRGRPHATILTRTYWLDDIYLMLDGLGFAEIELRMFAAGGYGTHCWFATVPPEPS
jgi:SAM-dependent methyltransferase